MGTVHVPPAWFCILNQFFYSIVSLFFLLNTVSLLKLHRDHAKSKKQRSVQSAE